MHPMRSRNVVYDDRRKMKGVTVQDFGYQGRGQIFINENLVASTKELLSDVNKARKGAGYKFLWSHNGKIYVKKNEKAFPIIIYRIYKEQDCSVSPEGFDIVMATNHVGHFVLTMTLMDLLKKSAPSRIINVSSVAHSFISDPAIVDYSKKASEGLNGFQRYAKSKLANLHFAKELARHLAGTNVSAYSLHPGTIYTNVVQTSINSMGKKIFILPIIWLFLLSEKDGAQTTIFCAIDESVTQHSGGYFANCQLGKESKLAKDMTLAKQLWDVSCEATGIDPSKLSA
ncbi:retinol dehydrogenase 11-like [Diadema setosum]|uniref:retinol dehydrogenase 11-like n=1 Tax=Diadema setosum TaxID=31175 RepID=UPI003B3A386D